MVWAGYAISERPFYEPKLNHMEVFNNIFYWIILVFCFGLTSVVDDLYTLNVVGYIFIGLIMGLILSNASFLLIGLINKITLITKRHYIHFKVKRALSRQTKLARIRLF